MEKVIRSFAKNKLLVNIMVILIVLIGIFSFNNVKRDHMPNVESRYMIINVSYPGASPTDVELNAVIPIEDEVDQISGIDEYTSVAYENGARITVVLEDEISDIQAVKDEIFRRISTSSVPDLSDDVKSISIIDFKPSIFTVIRLSVSPKNGDSVSDAHMFSFVDRLEKDVKRIDGVGDIDKDGYRDKEIHINVDPARMEGYYISLNEIVNSIALRNVRSTGGTMEMEDGERTVVTDGMFHNASEVGDVIVRSSFGDKRIYVKDLASIDEGYEDEVVRVSVNSRKSVILNVKKKEDSDIQDVTGSVRAFIENKKDEFPDDLKVEVIYDRSTKVTSLLGVVQSNLIIGFLLVFLTLLLFLDRRTSFWTAFGIPVSMLLTMTYMYLIDQTLNVITLGAIITVIGMLVDDGIVIADVIYENKRSGMSGINAAVAGTKSVLAPVTVTIVSTIAAFLPLLTIKGMMGQFIKFFPIIISAMLIFSLFEAVFILPNHLAHARVPKTNKKYWFKPVRKAYERMMKHVLRWRYAVIALFIVVFFGILKLSEGTIKDFVLMYDNSADTVSISIDGPEGYGLDDMGALTKRVEDVVRSVLREGEYLTISSTVGNEGSAGKNYADIRAYLVPIEQREREARYIGKELRPLLNKKDFPEIEKLFIRTSGGGPRGGAAIDIKIIGEDVAEMLVIRDELKSYMKTMKGVTDIDDDYGEGNEELAVTMDYDKMASLGLDVQDVSSTVRTAYNGVVATYIQTPKQRIDYVVEAGDGIKNTPEFLLNLLVPNSSGRLIRLGQVAKVKVVEGTSQIKHYQGDRTISVTAEVDEDITTSTKVNMAISEEFAGRMKNYPDVYLKYGGEAEETAEAMGGIVFAFGIAIFFIYFIMVLLFKSLTQPFIILLTIPFGLAGALLAFTLHGVPLSFMGLIGMIGLSGVVVNDSVVMVDFINKVFKSNPAADNKTVIDNVANGAKQRLRPVILTTVTTVMGLLPTVYGIGGNAMVIVPVVMAMAYGLLFASFLTLFFIPSLYMANNDMRKLFGFAQKSGDALAE